MELRHRVILVDANPKEIPSSEAHRRVLSSPLWKRRPKRAQVRHQKFLIALKEGNWNRVARLSWLETLDMHHLFHTSRPPFSYWKPATVQILRALLKTRTRKQPPPPIVSMDAGANIHVLPHPEDNGPGDTVPFEILNKLYLHNN
jgi:diphosphomevalonate decarboxylase